MPTDLVDGILAEASGGTLEFDAVPTIAQAFPLRVFPDAVGLPQQGRENLLPYGDHNFNAFGPPNDLVAKGAPRVAELSAWVDAQCARDVLAPEGFGADIWAASDRGDITVEQAPLMVRSLLRRASTPPSTASPRCCTRSPPIPTSGSGCAPSRPWPGSRSTRRCAGSRPCRPSSGPPPPTSGVGDHVVPDGKKILMFLGAANRDPRRWASPEHPDPDAFDLTRDPSGHVGFGMGIHQCIGQHVARLEAEAVLTALAAASQTSSSPARSAATTTTPCGPGSPSPFA